LSLFGQIPPKPCDRDLVLQRNSQSGAGLHSRGISSFPPVERATIFRRSIRPQNHHVDCRTRIAPALPASARASGGCRPPRHGPAGRSNRRADRSLAYSPEIEAARGDTDPYLMRVLRIVQVMLTPNGRSDREIISLWSILDRDSPRRSAFRKTPDDDGLPEMKRAARRRP
jgi:hypothetical protein